ncbi:hypothetical protein BT63DRAFT_429080 [Microthyrium microscopicum]|uniref:NAD dependent epimerase/dehydratase n=1 Tax=Microthyrium microscopicum TaxID=703497 RepID=A0A6A6U114_9PEZI|nr:hypothetical protein BT63DRAFT_429080 [Microthyrium microscopicum]
MSLRAAFEKLGYHGIYHYRVPSIEEPSHSALWVDAFKSKHELQKPIPKEDFDRIYSNYEVITDSPSVFFWPELLAAYPDAQVILQTRDIDAWYKSHMANIWPLNRDWYKPTWNPYGWLFQYFLPKTPLNEFTGIQAAHGHGLDFPETGKQRYREHNAAVIAACEAQGRPLLEYDVKMGWGPLCDFLGKDVPNEAYPRLNDTDEFQANWAPILADVRREINRKILLLVIGALGGLSSVWLYRSPLLVMIKKGVRRN